MQSQEVPVLVVGAGPVGTTLANLLGQYGIETLVIDRSGDVLDYPRAVGLDDEALRTFQSAGLVQEMLRDMIQNVPMRLYTANRKCFAEILPSTREFGWYRRNLFSQPLAERTLRRALERFPHVRLQLDTTLVALTQDAQGVTARFERRGEVSHEVHAQYLVAADGARSTVREVLLRIPGDGATHPHKWAVIECDDDPLDAPYTALHCEPKRPYVCLRLPYGVRRWEFMLFPGEDAERMLAAQQVEKLLSPYVEHPERLRIIRARVYTHDSRVARAFVSGRVCLAGDAAHLTPPWIGQGLNSGLRDVFNLAWKLAWILEGRIRADVLASYHEERHAHVRAMIELADVFGSVLGQRNRAVAWFRDRFFLAIRAIPPIRDYVLQMRFKPQPRYRKGVVLEGDAPGHRRLIGRMFIQPDVELEGGEIVRLDDALGLGFALLGWRCDPLANSPRELREKLEQLNCLRVLALRSRSCSAMRKRELVSQGLRVIEDSVNALHLWFESAGVEWVLIRPDRYVACVGHMHDAPIQLGAFVKRFMPAPAQRCVTGLDDGPSHVASGTNRKALDFRRGAGFPYLGRNTAVEIVIAKI